MAKNSKIEQAANTVEKKMKPKPVKRSRTLNLNDEMFREFQQLCLDTGYSVSEIVDELMAEYLSRAKKLGD